LLTRRLAESTALGNGRIGRPLNEGVKGRPRIDRKPTRSYVSALNPSAHVALQSRLAEAQIALHFPLVDSQSAIAGKFEHVAQFKP
jgi:hypothetical protein